MKKLLIPLFVLLFIAVGIGTWLLMSNNSNKKMCDDTVETTVATSNVQPLSTREPFFQGLGHGFLWTAPVVDRHVFTAPLDVRLYELSVNVRFTRIGATPVESIPVTFHINGIDHTIIVYENRAAFQSNFTITVQNRQLASEVRASVNVPSTHSVELANFVALGWREEEINPRFDVGQELTDAFDFLSWGVTEIMPVGGWTGMGELEDKTSTIFNNNSQRISGTVVEYETGESVSIQWEWLGQSHLHMEGDRNWAVEDVYILPKPTVFLGSQLGGYQIDFEYLSQSILGSSESTLTISYDLSQFANADVLRFHIIVIPVYRVDFIFRNHGAPDAIVSQRVKHGFTATELPYDHPIENGFAFCHWERRNFPDSWAFDFTTPITNLLHGMLLFPVFDIATITVIFHDRHGEPFYTATAEFISRGAVGDFRIPFIEAPEVYDYDWDQYWWFDSSDNFGLIPYQVFEIDADYRLLFYLSPFIRNGRVYLFTTYRLHPYVTVTYLCPDGDVLYLFVIRRGDWIGQRQSILPYIYDVPYHFPTWEKLAGEFLWDSGHIMHSAVFQLVFEEVFSIATFLNHDGSVFFEHRFAFLHQTIEMPVPPAIYGYWFRAWLTERWTPAGGYELRPVLWQDNPWWQHIGANTTVRAGTRTFFADFVYAPLVTFLCFDGEIVKEGRIWYSMRLLHPTAPEVYGATFVRWEVVEGNMSQTMRTIFQAIHAFMPYVLVTFMDWDGEIVAEVRAFHGLLSEWQLPNPTVFLADGRKLSHWFNPYYLEIDDLLTADTMFIAICVVDEDWTPPPPPSVEPEVDILMIILGGSVGLLLLVAIVSSSVKYNKKRRRAKT